MIELKEMIEVRVDLDRCDASGTCAVLLPDVFQIGEDGKLKQIKSEVEFDRADIVEEAVLCCPMGAISRR